MPRTILHILETAQPEGRGIARIVAGLDAGLDPRKYHLHAWFLGPPGPLVNELQAAGVAARSINWWQGARNPAGAFRFWRCLRKHDFAVVHLHQHYGSRTVRHLLARSTNARLVIHLHGGISESTSVRRPPTAVRDADAVIAVSRAVALQYRYLQPTVVYSGVGVSKEPYERLRKRGKELLVGTATRLVPKKGVMQLIQAFAELISEFPETELQIAGDGPQREELEQATHRLGLDNQVRFLGWQSDIRSVMQTWDVFVLPSLDEGLPIAVLEAMAEGLPVVATAIGGVPEIVENAITGDLILPSDTSGLVHSLRILLQNPELRYAMGLAGRRRVEEHFSPDRMALEIEAIYDSLVR